MAKKLETRIEERNRQAEHHRRDQNPVMHAISGAGLAMANAWDRVTAPFKSDRAIFAGATLFGVGRGATLGGLAAVIAIAVSGGALAPIAIPVFLGAAATGGVIAGVYDGQTALDNHWSQSNDAGNKIAKRTGAIPGPDDYIKQAPKDVQWDLAHPDKPSRTIAKANAVLAKVPDNKQAGFAEREDARRTGRGQNAIS